MEAYIGPINNSTRHWQRDFEICEIDFIKWACGNTSNFEKRGRRHHLRPEERTSNMTKLEEKTVRGLVKLGVMHEEETLLGFAIRLGLTQAVSDTEEGEELSTDGGSGDEYGFPSHVDGALEGHDSITSKGEEDGSQQHSSPRLAVPLSPSQSPLGHIHQDGSNIAKAGLSQRGATEDVAAAKKPWRSSEKTSSIKVLRQGPAVKRREESKSLQQPAERAASNVIEYGQESERPERKLNPVLRSQSSLANPRDGMLHLPADKPRQTGTPQPAVKSYPPKHTGGFGGVGIVDPYLIAKESVFPPAPLVEQETGSEHVRSRSQGMDTTNAAPRPQASIGMQNRSRLSASTNIRDIHRDFWAILSHTHDGEKLRRVISKARIPSGAALTDTEMDHAVDTLLGERSASPKPQTDSCHGAEEIDVRTIAPSHFGEEICVEKALDYTRHEFVSCFGKHPQPTDPSKCYNQQHSQLITEFEEEWYQRMPFTFAPKLHKFPEWKGDISLWPFEGLGLLWREW